MKINNGLKDIKEELIQGEINTKQSNRHNRAMSMFTKIAIGNCVMLVILSIVMLYYKGHYRSIESNYTTLVEEYDNSVKESNEHKTQLQSALSDKARQVTEYEKANNDFQTLMSRVDNQSNDLQANKQSLINQKNKTETSREAMYKEYNQANLERSVESLFESLNKTSFPFSDFPLNLNIPVRGYYSHIIRSIEDIQFIERITGYKINQPCFQSSQFLLKGYLFKNYCRDNKPNIVLYLTDRNIRFGGFTELGWDNDDEKFDQNAILFNLDNKKSWKAKLGHITVDRFMDSLPSYGEGDIRCTAGEVCTVNKWFMSFDKNDAEYEINGGYETFRVLSVEVYQSIKP